MRTISSSKKQTVAVEVGRCSHDPRTDVADLSWVLLRGRCGGVRKVLYTGVRATRGRGVGRGLHVPRLSSTSVSVNFTTHTLVFHGRRMDFSSN